MFSFSKDGIYIASILDKRKIKQNNSYPVKIRVTYQRDRKHYSTGKDLTIEDWDILPTTKNRHLKEVRESVENSFSIIRMNVLALAEIGGFSFDALNLRLSKGNIDTLNCAFNSKIDKLTIEGRIGSRDMCQNALICIEKFAGKKISFEVISIEWLKKFEKYMLKDKTYSTVGMYMREIRTVMNIAKKAGIIKETQYPFGKDKFEIKTAESKKKALTINQIGEIYKFNPGNDLTQKYKDLWFFSYMCNGINIADLIKLKFKDIVDDEICFVRQKTENTSKHRKEIKVLVIPQMKEIINTWGNKPNPENYIFSFLKGKETAEERKKITKSVTKSINNQMKKIGNHLDLGDITTYVARHSFATVLKRSGANIASISESLGHSDLKTTENYLASFEKGERIKNAGFLTDF